MDWFDESKLVAVMNLNAEFPSWLVYFRTRFPLQLRFIGNALQQLLIVSTKFQNRWENEIRNEK